MRDEPFGNPRRALSGEVARAVRGGCHAPLEGLMTHLASSGNYESKQTEEQLLRFAAVIDGLRAGRHHAALCAFLGYPSDRLSGGARGVGEQPGAAGSRHLWYVSPASRRYPPKVFECALRLSPGKVTVLEVKDVEAGAQIGYGGIHRAARPMRIAVLAAGYADGIPHRLGNRGQVIVKGKLAPVVGLPVFDGPDHHRRDRLPRSEDRRSGDAAGI